MKKQNNAPGALAYLDEQIDALKKHVPAALEQFDADAIHKARVATRRLSAGTKRLGVLFDEKRLKPVASAAKKIRRRLGPLRDYDVMIDSLKNYPARASLGPAIEWLVAGFEEERQAARQIDVKKKAHPQKLLDALDSWWALRHEAGQEAGAVGPLLLEALHGGFDEFARVADRVSGRESLTVGQGPVDVHELRIDGKILRYAFEIASAEGLKISKRVTRSFKAMQESLGDWHDSIVLADRAIARMVSAELMLHRPDLAVLVIDLVKTFLSNGERALKRFGRQWNGSGNRIGEELAKKLPLTRPIEPHQTEAPQEPQLNEAEA